MGWAISSFNVGWQQSAMKQNNCVSTVKTEGWKLQCCESYKRVAVVTDRSIEVICVWPVIPSASAYKCFYPYSRNIFVKSSLQCATEITNLIDWLNEVLPVLSPAMVHRDTWCVLPSLYSNPLVIDIKETPSLSLSLSLSLCVCVCVLTAFFKVNLG